MASSVVLDGLGKGTGTKVVEKPAKRLFVTVDMGDEEVLQLDREGANLFWDEKAMRELDPKVVGALSDLNASHYGVSAELLHGEKPSMLQKDVGRPWKTTTGYATQMLALPDSPKFDFRNARNDKVQMYLNKGWTYADPKEAPDRKTVEGHVGFKERKAEFVLLKRPKELGKAERAELDRKMERRRRGLRSDAIGEMRKTGYKVTDPLKNNEEV